MDRLVCPHGGKLLPLLAQGEDLKRGLDKARHLPQVKLNSREVSDLIMLGMGAFSPLRGFMTRGDYEGVLRDMRLKDGTFWPAPITLAVIKEHADSLREGEEVSLVDESSGEVVGIMSIEEKFSYDKDFEARNVFRTDDAKHPGVSKVYGQGEVLLGGPVKVLSEGEYPDRFPGHYGRPEEVRRTFEERGWSQVAAFQVRNPIHRSHEYCTKIALELSDGLFIHPLVGALKEDYYGPFDAQKIFNTLRQDDLQIKPLKIDWTFYCYKCEGMASLKTCPHSKEDRCLISGTELRRMLSRGEMPPPEFSRPEVLEILVDYYRGLKT
jgi:sulfate adenylyltransferase